VVVLAVWDAVAGWKESSKQRRQLDLVFLEALLALTCLLTSNNYKSVVVPTLAGIYALDGFDGIQRDASFPITISEDEIIATPIMSASLRYFSDSI